MRPVIFQRDKSVNLCRGEKYRLRMGNYRHINFHKIDDEDLLSFIEQRHHAYCKSMLELIIRNFRSATQSKGQFSPQSNQLLSALLELRDQVDALIRKEEETLFPYVRKMLQVRAQKEPYRFLDVNLTESSIRTLQEEHVNVMRVIAKIKSMTADFTPKADDEEILRLVYAELKEFGSDFSMHLHRELEFLFPRMIRLEDEVRQRTRQAAIGRDANWSAE